MIDRKGSKQFCREKQRRNRRWMDGDELDEWMLQSSGSCMEVLHGIRTLGVGGESWRGGVG